MNKNRKITSCFLVATLMITTSIIVIADWEPGVDGHKMHYPQLPDPFGWDVLATYPEIVADDWLCTESGYVDDIHFWGSWLWDFEGVIDGFWITIFSDIPDPDGPGPLYSMPGDILWQSYINDFDILFWGEYTASNVYNPPDKGSLVSSAFASASKVVLDLS